jgi:hypothetical protein
MSIFGNIAGSLSDIPDDPFYIKPDTYWAFCTEAVEKETKDGGTQLVITWTIDEPDNDYHHTTKQEYFNLYPQHESWADYSPDEKKATIWLKRRMRRGFDLSETEMATLVPSELIGKAAYITFRETSGKEGTANEGKKFVNIFDAVSKRLFDEEKGEDSSATSSSSSDLKLGL